MADQTQTFEWPSKDPDEIKKYWHDWTAALNEGEMISSVEALVNDDDQSGVVIDSGDTLTGNIQMVKLSGGQDNQSFRLTLRAQIDSGDQIYDVGIKGKIKTN